MKLLKKKSLLCDSFHLDIDLPTSRAQNFSEALKTTQKIAREARGGARSRSERGPLMSPEMRSEGLLGKSNLDRIGHEKDQE